MQRNNARARENRIYTLDTNPGGKKMTVERGSDGRGAAAVAVAAPRRNTGNAAYFFDDFRTRGRAFAYVYRVRACISLRFVYM